MMIAVSVIFIIAVIVLSIYTAGLLQQNLNSDVNSKNNDLAVYTGYLVNDSSYCSFLGNSDLPPRESNNVASLTFADGRTFIANETLLANRNVAINATYSVYYNATQPSIAIDIITISTG
jgi:hypothetical protein